MSYPVNPNKKRIAPTERWEPSERFLKVKQQPRPLSIEEKIAMAVRSERIAMIAAREGFDTFEEADDFNCPDDEFPQSDAELVFDRTTNREVPREAKREMDNRMREFNAFVDKQQAAIKKRKAEAVKIRKKQKQPALLDESSEGESAE